MYKNCKISSTCIKIYEIYEFGVIFCSKLNLGLIDKNKLNELFHNLRIP